MTAELLVYALIAAGLIFWLRSILGTRDEDDAQRPSLNLEIDDTGKVINFDTGADKGSDKAIALIDELAENPKGNMLIADKQTQETLIEIANADRDFDIYIFLQAAQDAFVYIVESFADGDRETLEDLLSAEVFQAFDGAISTREDAGETMVTEIHAISKSEIVEARLDGKEAHVTVRFWAEETSVTKDSDDKVVHGHPEQTTQMRDVWTICRNLKSSDPRWLVVETREDGEGDNETIPNTH